MFCDPGGCDTRVLIFQNVGVIILGISGISGILVVLNSGIFGVSQFPESTGSNFGDPGGPKWVNFGSGSRRQDEESFVLS